MSKVTSKLQVTLPKAIALRYGIEPGDEIEWEEAGEIIRVVPPHVQRANRLDLGTRLRLFDEATERQRRRNSRHTGEGIQERGWRREDLYDRGLTD